MVSRETLPAQTRLSKDFIAGIISTHGSFLHTHSARVEQFGFQIKLTATNYALLELIRESIGLKRPARLFREKNSSYTILTTRSKKELLTKLIPYIDGEIIGPKLAHFERWKALLNNDSGARQN